MSLTERIGGIIIAPKTTINYLINNPDWKTPILLPILGGIIWGLIFFVPIQNKTFFELFMSSIFAIGMIIGGLFFLVLKTHIVYFLIRISFKIEDRKEIFNKIFILFGYSFIPIFLRALFILIITIITHRYDLNQTIFSTAKLFPSMDDRNILYPVLANIEIFNIWNLILSALSVQTLFNLTFKKSLIILIIFLLICINVQVGINLYK